MSLGHRTSALLPAALLIALAGGVAAWTWRSWPDPLIDFGREAYLAWRLGEGAVLYRDIAFLGGPLSPYWNAGAMRLLGGGLDALYASNALLGAILTLLVYRLYSGISSARAGLFASALFVVTFAFARYMPVGNYNWLAPYTHELTHGIVLAFGALACVAAHGRGAHRAGWATAAGLLLGVVALTKVEVFVALLPAVLLGLALAPARARFDWRSPGVAALAATLPPLVAIALLALGAGLAAGEAAAGITAPWAALLDDRLTTLPFYLQGSGLDAPGRNALRFLHVAALQAAALLSLLAVVWWLRTRRTWSIAAAGALLLTLTVHALTIDWRDAFRPLPLWLFAILVWRARPLLRSRAAPRREGPRAGSELSLLVFALLLVGKLGLQARIYHYGFALAMPGVLLVAITAVSWIPRSLERAGRPGAVFAAVSGLVLVALVGVPLARMESLDRRLVGRFGSGPDLILADPARASILDAALREIDRVVPEDSALLVLPEGVMLNYQARRPTPSRFFSFTPFDLILWGEDEIVESIRRAPPGAVLVVHRRTAEYGALFLGSDYGQPLMDLVAREYEPVRQWGGPPLEPDTAFGARLLLRRASDR